jgi:hypothetical protein
MFICCVVCGVGSGLCDGVHICSEKSYRECVSVFDLETLTVKRPGPQLGLSATEEGKELTPVNGGILRSNMSGVRKRYPVTARQSVTAREFCSTPLVFLLE